MADLSEFEAITAITGKPRRLCAVGSVLPKLSEEDRANFEAALARNQEEIPVKALRIWLKKRGHVASIPGLTHHRLGTCRCVQDEILHG